MYDSLLINGTKESWYDGFWLVSNIINLSITGQQLWLESIMQENTEPLIGMNYSQRDKNSKKILSESILR